MRLFHSLGARYEKVLPPFVDFAILGTTKSPEFCDLRERVGLYIYIYAFSRRFYPKRLTLHSSYSFYILSALAFPGNRTHDLGVASAMLYQLSYSKAIVA